MNLDQKKIQKQNTENMFNTETMLPISEIKNNTVIMKDGWLRAIIKIDGLNIDLKNYDEIQIVLEQYKRFLSGLSFPIQILVRNNYLDLSDYINYIDANINKVTNPILKKQAASYKNFLNNIDMKQDMIFIKSFYIIVPYYIDEQDSKQIRKSWITKFLNTLNTKDNVEQIVARYRNLVKGKSMLDTRCSVIQDSLGSIGLWTQILNTWDIVSLLFNFYNPLMHTAQSHIESEEFI